MAIKSTQVIPVAAVRGGVAVVGSCRIIKYQHQKNDPTAQGIPQREVLIMNESGAVLIRITKFFRHSLLECDGIFETVPERLKLTLEGVQSLAARLLAIAENREELLQAATDWIEQQTSV